MQQYAAINLVDMSVMYWTWPTQFYTAGNKPANVSVYSRGDDTL